MQFLNSFVPNFEKLEAITKTCDTHGSYQSERMKLGERITETGCEACCEDEHRRKAMQAAKERREQQVVALLRSSEIPALHAGKQFDGYNAKTSAQSTALEITRLYAAALVARKETPGASLLLVGPPGTGKTHLACAIGEQIVRSLQETRYTTCSELTRRLRATYGQKPMESESDVHDELTTVRLLILDELAATSLSDHERRTLFEIIDTRYRELRPMVLISNLPAAELASIVGERIVDRLREVATTVAFDWRSHRRSTIEASELQHRRGD